MARVFPDREMAAGRRVPPDLLVLLRRSTQMRVRKGTDRLADACRTTAGLLYSVNIGTRAAVIFSPIDLSCGWDAERQPDRRRRPLRPVRRPQARLQHRHLLPGRVPVRPVLRPPEGLPPGDRRDPRPARRSASSSTTATGTRRRTACRTCSRRSTQSTTLHVQFKREPVDPEKGGHLPLPGPADGRPAEVRVQRRRPQAAPPVPRQRRHPDRRRRRAAPSRSATRLTAEVAKKLYPDKEMKDVPADHPMFKFVFDETHPQAVAPRQAAAQPRPRRRRKFKRHRGRRPVADHLQPDQPVGRVGTAAAGVQRRLQRPGFAAAGGGPVHVRGVALSAIGADVSGRGVALAGRARHAGRG